VSAVSEFLKDIDRSRSLSRPSKLRLRIIGSTALMLQADYERGTADSDVLETDAVTPEVKDRLLGIAGKGTALHTRHRLYVDVVARGIPFLPNVPRCHLLTELNESLKHLEFEVLDVVDVVVSKLKRFNANDVSGDIRAMVDLGLIEHQTLLARFRSAVDVFSGDARAEDFPRYVKNLHRVERDHLLVAETEIDLPSWIA
jgi:hypothetical protein